MPRGEHRDVVLVELGDRPCEVTLELVVWDLVHPGPDSLPEQLATGLAADRVSDCADGVGRVDEAEGHWREDRERSRRTGVRMTRAGCGLPSGSPPVPDLCSDECLHWS